MDASTATAGMRTNGILGLGNSMSKVGEMGKDHMSWDEIGADVIRMGKTMGNIEKAVGDTGRRGLEKPFVMTLA